MRVCRYIRGEDARRLEWVGNLQGWGTAWFVPQRELLPIAQDGSVPPCLRQRMARGRIPATSIR